MKVLSLLLAAASPIYAVFEWQNARMGGGGGFVPGVSFHPKVKGVAYARTDIGGLYRLNADDSWTPVTDYVATHAKWNRWGIDALALDPADANKVYAAFGMYTNSWDPNNGAIGRSSDKGQTWTFTDLPFKVGGNMPGRGTGERLAVDPNNPNIIYFGARSGNGLWKSTNGGVSFSKVTSFTNVGNFAPDPNDANGYLNDPQGLTFVTFDETSAVSGGATSRIFVGTADNVTASVYVSTNAGQTWSPVAGQPGKYFPHKARIQNAEKALYLSYSDGTGPYDGTSGSVWRYDLTTSVWKDITPASGGDLYFGFGGLSVDAQKPGTLIVATLNSWYPDAQIYRSTDSGTTWSTLWKWTSYPNQEFYYSISTPKAPWIFKNFISVDTKKLGWMIEALEIDPHDSNHWLYGTGLTVYGGHDLTKWDTTHNITIESLADGIEEFAVLEVKSAPGGTELFSAVGDDSGFTFPNKNSLGTAPATVWDTPRFTSSTSVDYAGNKVANVVRVGNSGGTEQVALSGNGGNTWYIHYGAGQVAYGGAVALSADGDVVLWSSSNQGVRRSQTQGTFAAVSSLPNNALIASDKRDNTAFYAASGSTFYRSTNSATSFSTAGTLSGATVIRDIAVHPQVAGDVWVSTDAGIFHSTNGGTSFTLVSSTVTNTYQIALGRGAGTTWNLYAFGTGPQGPKLYGSADLGASWTDIQGSIAWGSIEANRLEGSGNNAGLVYVGTNGRGVFWAQGTISGGSVPPPAGTTTTAAPPAATTTTRGTTTLTSTVRASTTVVPTTVATTTRAATTTTRAATTTAAAPPATGTGVAAPWGQCGGQGWTGPTQCAAGYTCKPQNTWYSQCLA
ncbi:Xyloglucanase like protein [Verticillium longisporum]|nr:Xyloglucanase like protein [Verticillium longisporum]